MAAVIGSRRLVVGLLAAVLSLSVSAPLAAADDRGDLAGNRPGAGRAHPGRSAAPAVPPMADDEQGGTVHGSARPAVPPAATAPADRPRYAAERAAEPVGDPVGDPVGGVGEAASERAAGSTTGPAAGQRRKADGPTSGRAMRVLPLGTGMALAGLGLAYFGLRLRRR
ncbi:hypothetical protein ACQUSR_16515 [Streptomyces sp. P1-3]|uniref:hypothetical protein n=1 Tax=Streptomyces sp. P1-3 TaxID=3421658 RepID=UPI003D3650A7